MLSRSPADLFDGNGIRMELESGLKVGRSAFDCILVSVLAPYLPPLGTIPESRFLLSFPTCVPVGLLGAE